MKYNKLIDHTILKADAKKESVEVLCKEAIEHDFMSVCVNPCNVKLCSELLKGSSVKVCTVIGFPLGQNTTATKVFETKDAISNGSQEIDMVINVASLKDKEYDYVLNEIKEIRKACENHTLKVILETCLLSDEEIVKACELCLEAKADFVKTSTGFSSGGATTHHVKLMRDTVKDNCGVKASGGVRTHEDLLDMVEAGASRIGTSNGCKII